MVAEAPGGQETVAPANGAARASMLPPGPRAPAIAQTLLWALAPAWLMRTCASRLGDSFTLTFAPSGVRVVIVSDPDEVKTLFTAGVALSGGAESPVAAVMGPNSIIVLTGPEHMRQRKLLLPPFHGERMRDYEQVILQATRREMASWPMGEQMSVEPRSRAITLEVILRAVFGVEADRMSALRETIEALLVSPSAFALLRASFRARAMAMAPPTTGPFAQALSRLDALILAEIASRRESADLAERADILSLLLLARDEDGEAMSDAELRDELVTLLVAGHDTTATSIAWVFERLVRHPDKLARLIAEIDEGEDDRYLTAVINETLRVRPVVPRAGRVLTEQLRVGSWDLPAGTRVLVSIYLTNRNAQAYGDPDAFRPERFLENAPETFSWIPFGGGIRRCIGASFAQHEVKLIVRTILSELEPTMPRRRPWRRDETISRRGTTLAPGAGAQVVWRRRHART
ncbi:MAG TPA: cytochrome P450 [Solirubrobacteraceae bacterium]|nr:cytochrome P450 [Solirubrobacteraceae bacterium]